MIELILFLAWGLYQVDLEKTEWELLCEEFLYNNSRMYEKFDCGQYELQPRNYLNIKN